MIGPAPKFITSPYFVPEAGNWHLKDGAPADVVKEFEAYMKAHEEFAKKMNSFKDEKHK